MDFCNRRIYIVIWFLCQICTAWAYPTNDVKWVEEYKISTLINSASVIDDKLSVCHISKGERHSYSYIKSLPSYLLSTYSKTKAILSHYWFLSGNVLLRALWSYTTETYFSGFWQIFQSSSISLINHSLRANKFHIH